MNRQLLGSVPCVQRNVASSAQVPVTVTTAVNGLGRQVNTCCRYVRMNGNLIWVCFTPCPSGGGGGDLVHGVATNPAAVPPVSTSPVLPYCDQVTFLDEVMYWIEQNPFLTAGIAIGIGYVLFRRKKR